MLFDVVQPLLGFENITQITLEKIDEIFMRLESPDSKEITFTLVDPFALREYSFDIATATQELLEIDEKSNVLIYNIVILQSPIENSVVNFVAPIVFNTSSKKAGQIIISNDPTLSVAQPISTFLKG